MRAGFAHDAVVRLTPGGDEGAPGAAITLALCGTWDHPPPCPLAPHHTDVVAASDELRLRTLFATEPEREDEVRERIESALAAGELIGPDGRITRWNLLSGAPGILGAQDDDHVEQLLRS